MPYVSRDASGLVTGIFLKSQSNVTEFLPNDHPDILRFFGGALPQNLTNNALMDLTQSDIDFIRVIEDLVDILINKNVITFTDLPSKVREKIVNRLDARGRLAGTNDIVVSDNGIL
ncbi:MAG TPA: hypothetical protein VIO39_06390 [Methylotenera sp.]|jgi:hypothetical protein